MRETYILGISMTPFGKYPDLSLSTLAYDPIWQAINDSQIDPHDIEISFVGNAYGGLITGQESVRGQTILREAGLFVKPIINVENACASGSTAFYMAHWAVASGQANLALAVGVEKLFCGDTAKSLQALATSSDLEVEGKMGIVFAGIYAMRLQAYAKKYGITRKQMAQVAVKNHDHGALNPYAQHRKRFTEEEILESNVIADPITLLMTCPIGDGAAACLIGTKEMAKKMNKRPVKIAATVLGSFGYPGRSGESVTTRTSKQAYRESGIAPSEIQIAELHDAVAPIELFLYEELGLCDPGESVRLIENRDVWYTGRFPVNTSGGLTAKGHPAGATGIGQLAEVVWQMRGEAGARQVKPYPNIGMAENGGGNVAGETAVVAMHLLKAE
ncbi:thiolase family protein [Thermodesulfobacteriota bacterium]